MGCKLRLALDVLIWTAVVYFEISLGVLAISMIREQPIKFFIFSVDTVPEADPAVKMFFLILVLFLSVGLAFLAGIEVWMLRIWLRQHAKSTQNANHSS